MNDLASRLRSEAREVASTADTAFAGRIRSGLPATMPMRGAQFVALPAMLAAAALVVATLSLAWLAAGREAPRQPERMTAIPAPPTLEEMLGGAGAGLPHAAVADELAALGADLSAVAKTVRGAVPF